MTWNYRICKFPNDNGYGLHEVYYDDNGEVTSWTENAVEFSVWGSDGPDDIIKSLEMALEDAKKYPIFEIPIEK